jgi:hypothetical protein
MIQRRCCYCEREFGLKPPKGASHGVCVHHALESIPDLPLSLQEHYAARIKYQRNQNPYAFCPDFGANYDG